MHGRGRGALVAMLSGALGCSGYATEVSEGGLGPPSSAGQTTSSGEAGSDGSPTDGAGSADGDGDTGPGNSAGSTSASASTGDSSVPGSSGEDTVGVGEDTMGMGEDSSGGGEGSDGGEPMGCAAAPTCQACFECSVLSECILTAGGCQLFTACANELDCMVQCDPSDDPCLEACDVDYAWEAYECLQNSCPGCSI